jgi:hypothetical protein
MTKKKKKPERAPEFIPPDGAHYVCDGTILVGYVVWERDDQWRAYSAAGKDLGLFPDNRSAARACPSTPSEKPSQSGGNTAL